MHTTPKPYKGLAMEGAFARWYAKNTRGAARSYEQSAEDAAKRLAAGSRVLEVAPGPGYLAIALAKLDSLQVCGLDISKTFVRLASENARAAGVHVDFRQGNASAMPFPEGSFDFVICRAAFKNFTDPVGALDEIHRVLKLGGKASIIDLRHDASGAEIEEEVRGMGLSRLNDILTRLAFRFFLLRNAYTLEALERLVAQSRFGKGVILSSGIGFELRLTK